MSECRFKGAPLIFVVRGTLPSNQHGDKGGNDNDDGEGMIHIEYEKRGVNDVIVEKLLSAAMSAPSAVNQQPWEFIVITDREMLDAIPTVSKFARMAAHAPLGILVCGDTRNLISPDSGCKTALRLRRTF